VAKASILGPLLGLLAVACGSKSPAILEQPGADAEADVDAAAAPPYPDPDPLPIEDAAPSAPSVAHAGTAPGGLRASGDGGLEGCTRADASPFDAGSLDAGSDADADAGSIEVLASGQPRTLSIAADGVNVYWTTSDSVIGMPLADGPPVVLATGQLVPHGLAVDGTSVYWSNTDGSVMKAPIAGGPWTLLATGTAYEVPSGGARTLGLDATRVYWTNPGTGAGDGKVLAVPIDGGAVVVLASGEESPSALAVGVTAVYYAAGGSIKVVPVAGGAPATIASGAEVDLPGAIAVDSESVYWTNQSAGKVMKATLGGGDPQTLASEEGVAGDLAVDATGVYWLQSLVNDDRVLYVGLDGGPPATLASTAPGNLNEMSLALDCSRVYWTASTLGVVDPGNTQNDVAPIGEILATAK
jgi:hypothetical protein